MKKILIIAVILSVLTLLGFAFIKVIYPKYIDKPSNMIIETSSLDFDWYQDQTFVPVKLTVFEAHNNAYYAFNPFEGKIRFINSEGVIVWENDFYMQLCIFIRISNIYHHFILNFVQKYGICFVFTTG